MQGYNVKTNYIAPMVGSVTEQRMKEIHFARLEDMLVKGLTVAKGYPRVMEGDVMGRITATGKLRRYTRCYVHAAVTSDKTKFVVEDGLGNVIEPPYKVGEILDIGTGPKVNDGTIAAIDYKTGEITLSAAVGGSGLAEHDAVTLATDDGSLTAIGVAQHPLFNANFDPADPNTLILLSDDFLCDLILSGDLKKSQLRGWDTTAATALSARDLTPAFDAVLF